MGSVTAIEYRGVRSRALRGLFAGRGVTGRGLP